MNADLNLENPIFVIYVNVAGMSRQKAEETLGSFQDQFKYNNVTSWMVPIISGADSHIDLIWKGSKYSNEIKDESIGDLVCRINDIIDVISEGTSDASLKSQLRNLKIEQIL